MVSLENKSNFFSRINENQKLAAFNSFLLNRPIPKSINEDLNESEEIYYGVLNAIQANNHSNFESCYNRKNKSSPSKDSPSPFVNDDFLIFSLIIGIIRFGFDREWIKKIISIRAKNPTTTTLENILNENYYSKSNLFEIVLMYLHLNDPSLINNDLLNNTFKSISENVKLFESKSDFQIICSLRAYDLIIELKEAPNGSTIDLLKKFNLRFLRRIKILTSITQAVLLIFFFYALIKLISYLPFLREFFEKYDPVFTILSVLGLSLIGNLIPVVKKKLYDVTLRLFGYPKKLVDEVLKK